MSSSVTSTTNPAANPTASPATAKETATSSPPVSPLASSELDNLCVNTLRFLAVDMVQKANSGHPGLPLGAAPMAYALWSRFLTDRRGQ